MKYLILGVLAIVCSNVAAADAQPAAAMPSATRAFDCGPALRVDVVLRSAATPESQSAVYNGVAKVDVNGKAADPMTLRFINEKIAGRSIDALAETCQEEKQMQLVFSTGASEAKTEMLTVTAQGNMVTVR